MALSYRQVSDVYDTLKSAGVVQDDLPTFSANLNQQSGTDDYSAGLNDNFVKRGSVGLDRLLEATGLPTAGQALGQAVGGLVGAPDVGADIGHGLPRMAANFVPALAGPWGLPAVAALSGAETYTNTGSPGAGVISGLANAAMPGVAGLAERGVLRALGTRALAGPIADAAGNVIGHANQYFPTAGQSVASFLGGQAAAAGLGEVSNAAQAAIDPNGHYSFSPTSQLLNLTLGQLPFAAMHLAGKVAGREASPTSYTDLQNQLKASDTAIREKAARDAANVANPIASIPDFTQPMEPNPVLEAGISAQLAKLRVDKPGVLATGNPDSIRTYDDLSNQELQLMSQSDKTGVLGEQVQPESDRFNVVGTTHFEKPGYRIVKVANDPANIDAGYKPDQLIGYSTKFEPPIKPDEVTAGQNVYSIPKRFHDPNVVDNKAIIDVAKPTVDSQTTDFISKFPTLYRYADKEGGNLNDVNGHFYGTHSESTDLYATENRTKETAELNPQAKGYHSRKDKTEIAVEHGWLTQDEADTYNESSNIEHHKIDALLANKMRELGYDYYTFNEDPMGYNPDVSVLNKRALLDKDVNALPIQQISGLDKVREQAADFARVKTQLDNVQEGDTEGMRQALEATNGMRQKWGYEPMTDEQVAKRMEQVQAKTPLDAVKGDTNSLMDRIARKEQLMQQREAEKAQLATQAGAIKEEFQKTGQGDITNLEREFNKSTRAGSKPDLFDRVLTSWDSAGRPNKLEGLATRLAEAKRTGRVAPKEDAMVNKTEVAAKATDQATEHVRQVRRSVADTVTEGVNPDLEGDAQEFREAFGDGSLTSDPALREFAKQEHVQEWHADAENELRKLGVHDQPRPSRTTEHIINPLQSLMKAGFQKQGTHYFKQEGSAYARISINPTELVIHDLAVLPEAQGQGQGGKLLEKIKAIAGDKLVTLVSSAKDKARQSDLDKFYTSHGFVRDGNELVWSRGQDNLLTNSLRIGSDTSPSRSLPYEPQTPYEQQKIASASPDEGGTGLVNYLYRSSDPVTAGLARDIQQNFPESLKRIKVRIMNMSQEGFAQPFGNREVEIQLSHGTVLSPDAVRSEQVMMHELLHGLTLAELDNPTKKEFVVQLQALRDRLIQALPWDIKSKYIEATNSDWLARYQANDSSAQMSDLGKSDPWRQVVYGLLDNRELVSQGFTDPSMKKFMQALKNPGEPKGNVFTRWVKRLLGIGDKVSDNEFAKFLDITSNIMTHGNWVSDLSNFTDHWYTDKGYSPTVARNLSQRALEVVQSSALPMTKDSLNDFLTGEDPVTKSFSNAKQAVSDMYAENGVDAESAKAVLGELKYPTDSLDGLLTEHLGGRVSDMDTAMQMLPPQVTKYLFERASDMQDVLGSVKAAIDGKNEGLLNIADPSKLRKPVEQSLDSLNKFLKYQDEDNTNRQALMRMSSIAPDAFLDGVLREPSRAPGKSDEEKGLMNWVGNAIGAAGGRGFEHLLQQPAQIARSNPIFAEWYSKAMMMGAKINQMKDASLNIFSRVIKSDGTLGPEMVKDELDRTYKAISSPKLRDALDKFIFLKQQRGGGEVRQIDYNDPEAQKIMSGLSPDERNNLIMLDNKIRLSKVAADQQILSGMRGIFSSLGARLTMRDMGMKLEPATALSTSLFDAVNSDFSNPNEAMQANAAIAGVQAKMEPNAFLNLLKFTQDSVEQHKAYTDQLAKNPDWVSAVRNGSYLFEYYKNGKMVLSSAENKKEAMQRAGGREIVNWRKNERSDDDYNFGGKFNGADISRLRELEGNQLDALKASGATPDDIASFQRMSVVSQIEREVNAAERGQNPQTRGARTLSRGAEELLWFENHLDWVGKNASYVQRRLLKTQGESMLLEPGTEGTPTANLIRQHMDSLFQRDTDLGRAIQQVTSTWSLGFNLASNMAIASQTWMRGVTELIRMGHGPLAAFKQISNAWGDYAGTKLGSKPYRTPEEAKFIKDALSDAQIDPTIFDSNEAAKANIATNFKRIMSKDKPKDLGQYLSSAAGAYQTAGLWSLKQVHRANSEVTLLAAYRALKELQPNLSYEETKKQVYLANSAVNDTGGRANRPIGLYSGKGDFARTVAMTMSSLQSYMLGTTFQLVRNLKAGLFRPEGIAPSEVYAARKAALYQLGVHMAGAGVLGLPFASGSLALINQLFPELEINKKVREGVAGLFGNSEDGHITTDMAMTGIPSMLGWDVSSRLSAGNVLPGVSEYDGFQPEQLLGVPFSNVVGFVKGIKQLAQGDPNGGYAFVPPAVRKITQLAMNGGVMKDYKDRPLLNPTPGETLGVALGFNPKRLTDLNVANRMALQEQEQATRRSGQQNQQYAEQALQGNFGTVRQQLLQQQAADKSYNARDNIRSIAQAAEDMTFPKDLRNQGSVGNAPTRQQLLSSFNLDPSTTSEVSRLQFRQGIEQRLGLVENDREALALASAMDQLRQGSPDATRAQLRQGATALLRRTHPLLLGDQ